MSPHFFKKTQKIVDIQNIRSILEHCSFDTLGTFDLDNTLIRPTKARDLGSDQWFSMLLTHAKKVISDPEEALSLSVALSDYVQHIIKVKPVEMNAADIIRRLQDVGLSMCGLTARGPETCDITEKQLSSIGIRFTDALGKEFPLDIGNPKKNVWYKNGVIYCDGADKGKCLTAFLKHMDCHYSVTMVDDTARNLDKIFAASEEGDFSFVGLHYVAMENRVKSFEMPQAMEVLNKSLHKLPKEALEIIRRLQLDTDKQATDSSALKT